MPTSSSARSIDESMDGQVRVTVIATGFGQAREDAREGRQGLERENVVSFERAINDDLAVAGTGSHSFTSGVRQTFQAGKPKNGAIPQQTRPAPLTLDDLDIPTFIRRQID